MLQLKPLLLFVPIWSLPLLANALYPDGNIDADHSIVGDMDSCEARIAVGASVVEAREWFAGGESSCPIRGGDYFEETNGGWVAWPQCRVRTCFRDDRPDSALARAFRDWDYGQTCEPKDKWTNSQGCKGDLPMSHADFHDAIQASAEGKQGRWAAWGGSGETNDYVIYKEGAPNTPKEYRDQMPDYCLMHPVHKSCVPPPIRTQAEWEFKCNESKEGMTTKEACAAHKEIPGEMHNEAGTLGFGAFMDQPGPTRAGESMSFPIWHTDGTKYEIPANPDLLLTGKNTCQHEKWFLGGVDAFRDEEGCKPGTKGSDPIKPGVYKVKGDPIRTGSHSICATYEIMNSKHERYSWEVLKPDFQWILNYGAPGPSQKGFWWVLHKEKQVFGQQDMGHTGFVMNPALHLMGYTGSSTPPQFQHFPTKEYTTEHQFKKNISYRRQLVCSVYDSFNNYLSVYVNGVLFGEKHLNMYDHNSGVSNQWGNLVDVYEPDLYVGVAPQHQLTPQQREQTGLKRFANLLGWWNKDTNGSNFNGEFLFVGVWNNKLLTKREISTMAGIAPEARPDVSVPNIPVHKPNASSQNAKTPREALNIIDQKRNECSDYENCSDDNKYMYEMHFGGDGGSSSNNNNNNSNNNNNNNNNPQKCQNAETKKDKFILEGKKKKKTKKCRWLMKKKQGNARRKICRKDVLNDGFKKVHDVCPKACGLVGEGRCSFLQQN